MLVRFMMYLSEIYAQTISQSIGAIYWHGTMSRFVSLENVSGQCCNTWLFSTTKKINHSIQADNGFENLVGHMTRQIHVFIAPNKVKICENHFKQIIKTNGWVQGLCLHVHMSFHVFFIGTHGSCSKHHVPCMRY